MKFTFTLVKNIELSNITSITSHGEQGWILEKFDDYLTDCIYVRKTFSADFFSEYAVMRYFEAMCDLAEGKILLLKAEAEEDGITISKNKEHCEWEMRKDGKLFRYNLSYHLFEEVKEVTNA